MISDIGQTCKIWGVADHEQDVLAQSVHLGLHLTASRIVIAGAGLVDRQLQHFDLLRDHSMVAAGMLSPTGVMEPLRDRHIGASR
ncbi:hypothetical protein [Aquabacterium parvum]|uniref:hypothetical protein n=1 Tax=Aquabacterium parvum TaxID=70584 RepID=UPI00128EEAA6|nr:hypothetical protein [Aquabacterium parvum]